MSINTKIFIFTYEYDTGCLAIVKQKCLLTYSFSRFLHMTVSGKMLSQYNKSKVSAYGEESEAVMRRVCSEHPSPAVPLPCSAEGLSLL